MIRPANTGDGQAAQGASGLLDKMKSGSARVGVIGVGYVGLPTMVAAAEIGLSVVGIDISESRVSDINAGRSYIEDVSDEILRPLVKAGMISATTDYSVIHEMDIVLVCVPTPITKNKEPNLELLELAIGGLAANLKRDQLIVLQSTTYPGSTEEIVLSKLERPGWKVGRDFFLAFASERIDPGNREFAVRNVPKVVGGITPECTRVASKFFEYFVDQVLPVTSPKVAEMTKLLENTFRSVNIALVNELAMLCRRMDIDIWEVIEAASTKPFGFMPFYPGPGVGGHCIPVDPFYLSWKAKEFDFYINFIQLAAQTNDYMPYYSLSRITEVLSDHEKPLKGAKVLILGVTFKEGIKDTRNSPAIRIIELLLESGAAVEYSDHNVPALDINGICMKSLDLEPGRIRNFDAVVILVNNAGYDLAEIVDNAKLIIDTRNATGKMGPLANVVKL